MYKDIQKTYIYIYIYTYIYMSYIYRTWILGDQSKTPFSMRRAPPPPGRHQKPAFRGSRFLSNFDVLVILFGLHFGCFSVFFPFHFRTCFWGCFVLCFFIEFGTFDLQNDASYVSKTDSCLKLPLLKQLEKSMISGPLLALFCHQSFFMLDFCMFSGMCFQ